MIEVQSRDGELIFKDYGNREVTIPKDDYLELISSPERQKIRPALEECLLKPTEVWWTYEEIDGKDYSYYKYFKVYRNLVFVAYVLLDDFNNFHLNNFYGFGENEFDEAEKERRGQPIISHVGKAQQ